MTAVKAAPRLFVDRRCAICTRWYDGPFVGLFADGTLRSVPDGWQLVDDRCLCPQCVSNLQGGPKPKGG